MVELLDFLTTTFDHNRSSSGPEEDLAIMVETLSLIIKVVVESPIVLPYSIATTTPCHFRNI